MNRCLLLTRPNSDRATRQISFWAQEVIDLAKEKGDDVLDLDGRKANRKDFEGRTQKRNPSFVFLIGHGNESIVAGQNDEPVVVAQENASILSKKIVYALACKAARVLGHVAVKLGAKAFIGYEDDFVFLSRDEQRARPLEDKILGLFLRPSNQVAISLLKGHTAGEASNNSRNYFRKEIVQLLDSEATFEETAAIPWLVWDLQKQVCLGDGSARF